MATTIRSYGFLEVTEYPKEVAKTTPEHDALYVAFKAWSRDPSSNPKPTKP